MDEKSASCVSRAANEVGKPLCTRLVALRRWFHRHPELSFQEAETAERIISELTRLGIKYEYAGVGHAVFAMIDGNDASIPTIALRAEMDALP